MRRYDQRNVLILGAGRSGHAAARLIQERRGRATIIDEHWQADDRAAFALEGISCASGERFRLPDGSYNLVVTSPSIPMDHPWILQARDRGLAIISELELAANYWQGEIIAVTGSKGKSSLVKCLTDTLAAAGHTAVTAGNYGTPLCERVLSCADSGAGTVAVTEVSSFQLEHTRTFSPRFAAILNIQADHLDRHGTLEAYTQLKERIFQAQKPGSFAFLPWGISPRSVQPEVAVIRFGTEAWVDWRFKDGTVSSKQTNVSVEGVFNNPVLGPAAALITAILHSYGLSAEQIAAGLKAFTPLPHRFNRLGTLNGIVFIDDSKATSLTATEAALRMVGSGIHLIAGGRLKETDLEFLEDTLCDTVKQVYLIGEAQDALYDAWMPFVPCIKCGTLQEAVKTAFPAATAGETILLSPGCASFDQYSGMGERGDDFIQQFNQLLTTNQSR